MRDKDGWELSRKQRERYFESYKLLHGGVDKPQVGIVAPRLNLEDLQLSHEKLPGRVVDGQPPAPEAASRVPRGTRRPKAIKEWREQADIYKWTQTVHVLRGFVMKFDNEGRRTVVQAAVSKRMGLLAGTSDLFVARPVSGFHGLWLEVKQNRNYTPSERAKDTWKQQEAFQARMRSVGFAATFCFGAEEGIGIIKKYLSGIVRGNY